MKRKVSRFVGLSLFGLSTLLSGGCIDWADVQFGFNAGLGAIPANIVGNFITANFLGVTGDDAED